MSSKRYPEEFKIEAVKQVTERGHPVADVANRIGVSQNSLYQWIKLYGLPESKRQEAQGQAAEIRRLKAELKRVTEERDILKKAAAYFAKPGWCKPGLRSTGMRYLPTGSLRSMVNPLSKLIHYDNDKEIFESWNL